MKHKISSIFLILLLLGFLDPTIAYSAVKSCTLVSASITSNCSGGDSPDCEVGETIEMKGQWDGSCNLTANTYFQIDAKSLDGSCKVQYTGGSIQGITKKDPFKGTTKKSECGGPWAKVNYTVNGDGTCTATFDNRDDGDVRWRRDKTPHYIHNDSDNTIEFGNSFCVSCGDTDYRAYVESDIYTIYSGSLVTDTVLKYHGPAYTKSDSTIKSWENSQAPSDGLSGKQIYQTIGDGKTYVSDPNFPAPGENQKIDLGPEADADVKAKIDAGGPVWFAIGLMDGPSGTRIYSEEEPTADPEPTFEITYFPPYLSDSWTITSISGDCSEKTVYAYSASLWDGPPGVGSLMAITNNVNGNFKFAAVPIPPCSISTEKDDYFLEETVVMFYENAPAGSSLSFCQPDNVTCTGPIAVSGSGIETYYLKDDDPIGKWIVKLKDTDCDVSHQVNVRAIPIEPPKVPAIIYPTRADSPIWAGEIEFRWTDPGANYYHYRINLPSGGPREGITNLTYVKIYDLGLGNHSWAVRACNDMEGKDCGDWSNVPPEPFEIISAPLKFLKGLVPCGRKYDNPNTEFIESKPCELLDIFLLLQILLEFILWRLGPLILALLILLIGVISYFAPGFPSTIARIKSILRSALVGYLILLLSWIAITLILRILGFTMGKWWILTF